jgi:hypothetical protein
MKRVVILAAGLAMAMPLGYAAGLEDVSLHFSGHTAIVWQAPTNHLPKRFWTYKIVPQVFSAAAISNGIVLAGFEKKGFPRPSTNNLVLWADHPDIEPQPPYFAIHPSNGQMSFTLGDRAPGSSKDIARDGTAVRRALKCAGLLGVDPKDLAPTNSATAGIYGVFLARQIDGVRFFDDTEGLQIEFGKDGKIRQFGLMWPKLVRDESCATASPEEIVRCIRGGKTVLVPADEEGNYLAQVRDVARAKRITITHVTPHYGEGVIGEELPENQPAKCVRPTVILGCTADCGTNAVFVQIYAPILASDVRRLLGSRAEKIPGRAPGR